MTRALQHERSELRQQLFDGQYLRSGGMYYDPRQPGFRPNILSGQAEYK